MGEPFGRPFPKYMRRFFWIFLGVMLLGIVGVSRAFVAESRDWDTGYRVAFGLTVIATTAGFITMGVAIICIVVDLFKRLRK